MGAVGSPKKLSKAYHRPSLMKLDEVCMYELSQYGEANEISNSIQLNSESTLPKISRFVILKRSDSFSLSAISRLSCETVDRAILGGDFRLIHSRNLV